MTGEDAEAVASHKMAKRKEAIETSDDAPKADDLFDRRLVLVGALAFTAFVGVSVAMDLGLIALAVASLLTGGIVEFAVGVVDEDRESAVVEAVAAPIAGTGIVVVVGALIVAGLLPSVLAVDSGVVALLAFVSPGLAVLSGIGNWATATVRGDAGDRRHG